MMAPMGDNTFGARLGQIIAQRDLTQGQVELKTGLGQGHISQIIAGKRRPRIDIATALADALNVSLDWLAGRERRHQPPLAPDQQALLEAYARLAEGHKAAVLNMVRELAGKE